MMLGFFKKKNVVETLPIEKEVKKQTLEDKIVEVCGGFTAAQINTFFMDFSEKQVMGARKGREKDAVIFYITQKGWEGYTEDDLDRGRLELWDKHKLGSVFLYFLPTDKKYIYSQEKYQLKIIDKNYIESPKFYEFLVLLEEKTKVKEKQRQQEHKEWEIKCEENRKIALKKEQEIKAILQQEWS